MFHHLPAAIRRTLPRLHSQAPRPRPSPPPSPENRGIRAEHFRALLSPIPPHSRRRHKLRWDWHLRNLIYSMIPPFVMYILLSIAERNFQLKDDQMRDSVQRVMRGLPVEDEGEGEKEAGDVVSGGREGDGAARTGARLSVEQRVAELERMMAAVAGEKVVRSAREIAREVGREQGGSAESDG
eukprot:GFKZ01006158.1.p1 GENE.GFKZ01006158.1~~GFKZ01006158.1.p1  ORF type:complete len:183 (-),score=25.50 GFKZ01006158.1:40-588(-)